MASDKGAANVKKKMDQIHKETEPAQTVVAGVGDGRTVPLGQDASAVPRQQGVMDEQFPTADLQTPDPRDALMSQKIQLADERGITPFGRLVASDSDFDWLDRKRQQEDEANFQAWFAQNYDYMAPEQKAVARRLWPNFYEQRQRLLEKNVKLQQKIAELKLHGPQSKEDLLLQYAVESGYIPADPLENILHPERSREAAEKAARQETFVRGLLNPKARTTRGGGARSRAVNAARLTSFAAAKVPGMPAFSGTKRDGVNQGFSVSDWPLTDSEAAANNPDREGNPFGPGLIGRGHAPTGPNLQ